ncbi:MAG: peptidoglycan DD-metalloendopeptidase family protein [Patescibacteria group bacterium]|nr:peptidoglycan DD-metalloendopeptidase family protein [Patescibacteria group bacterium]
MKQREPSYRPERKHSTGRLPVINAFSQSVEIEPAPDSLSLSKNDFATERAEIEKHRLKNRHHQLSQAVELRHAIAELTLMVIAAMVRAIDWLFFQHSFSRVKKNVFKYGLELSILILVLASVAVTFSPNPKKVLSAENLFLNYLENNPGLNQVAQELAGTESISVIPESAALVPSVQAATLDPMTAIATSPLATVTESGTQNTPALIISEDSTLIKPNYATRDAGRNRDIQQYTVQGGDTISQIAETFGISVQTVMYENKISDTDYLKPGQVLKILPTTGISHKVASGETLESIAKKYQVDLESILEFNQIEVPDDIEVGEELIIPNGKAQSTPTRQTQIAQYNTRNVKQVQVPDDFAGGSELIWPIGIRSVTQYYSSRHKALDISNSQRPQFWASADGIVELSGWDGAYGNSVVINHGNGLKTRYAHASELYVTAGDHVVAGQVIGRVGNTGRAYGATGNHLHFEIVVNGTKVNPLTHMK